MKLRRTRCAIFWPSGNSLCEYVRVYVRKWSLDKCHFYKSV